MSEIHNASFGTVLAPAVFTLGVAPPGHAKSVNARFQTVVILDRTEIGTLGRQLVVENFVINEE